MLAFDFVIAIAYFAIPLELLYCFLWYPFPVRTKPAIFCALFVSFITLCGGTHLVRAFDFELAVPIITGICMVISLLTAVMLIWLIPGVFKLAKTLEQERAQKLMLESLQLALREAVEGPEDVKTSLNILRAVPHCSNRQLRLLTAAKSSLTRMLGSSCVDIAAAQGMNMNQPDKVVMPINGLFVILVDANTHAKPLEMLERASLTIAQLFMETGDMVFV